MSKIRKKTKEMCEGFINEPKILIYDNESLNYIVGNIGYFDCEPDEPIEVTSIESVRKEYIPAMEGTLTCRTPNFERLNNIELDETTMKRIAKYNKEIDIKKLDEKIKEREEKIKELDNVLQDRDKRVNKLKEFVANLYNIDIEDNNYYDDYDDYD